MNYQYIFILGRNQELSLAEIEAVLDCYGIGYELGKQIDEAIIISCQTELDLKSLQNQLGGTIKIAKVRKEMGLVDLAKTLITEIQEIFLLRGDGRFQYGFSSFGKIDSSELMRIGLKIKKELTSLGQRPVRFIVSKEKNLSSVIVWKEKLLSQGADIVIFVAGSKVLIGQTITCQDWQDYASRDFTRPSRDDASGMLPPKLAKIMLNLGGLKNGQVVYDPFCGSGTILQEAVLLGATQVIGSDISEKAVKSSQANINWLITKNNFSSSMSRVFLADVTDAQQLDITEKADLICTEPYLGPAQNKFFSIKQYQDLVLDLRQLYLKALANLGTILKPGGKVVMVWPIISEQPTFDLAQVESNGWVLKSIGRSSSALIYSRPNQIVKRQIVVLVRN